MTLFSAETLDLSRLPAFTLADADYEAILAAHKSGFVARWQEERERNPALPLFDVESLETDPAIIAMQEDSWRRLLDLQALNDAAKRLTLAYADGAALAHLAATYHRTERAIVVPATDTTPAVYETDDALRARAQLAPEELADLGISPGGYIGKVRRAFTARIKDVRPIRRGGGAIELRVLGSTGDGTVEDATLADIIRAFQPEGMTQSTDVLTVFAAEIEHFAPHLTLMIPHGPDPATVTAAAEANLSAYRAGVHRIGASVYAEALTSAAHVGPVIAVRLDSPGLDDQGRVFAGRPEAAPFIGEVTLVTEVV
jgi:phage-related baseplate assembly protein